MASAIVTYARVSAEGQELRAMQNRITWAIAIEHPRMRVVQAHQGLDIGVEHGLAIRVDKTRRGVRGIAHFELPADLFGISK